MLHKSAEYFVHAVHIGLLAQQIGVLMCTDSVSSADICEYFYYFGFY